MNGEDQVIPLPRLSLMAGGLDEDPFPLLLQYHRIASRGARVFVAPNLCEFPDRYRFNVLVHGRKFCPREPGVLLRKLPPKLNRTAPTPRLQTQPQPVGRTGSPRHHVCAPPPRSRPRLPRCVVLRPQKQPTSHHLTRNAQCYAFISKISLSPAHRLTSHQRECAAMPFYRAAGRPAFCPSIGPGLRLAGRFRRHAVHCRVYRRSVFERERFE
jgi:hypothetical protein